MRTINYVMFVAIVGLVLTGCKSTEDTDAPAGEPASMTITLKGSQSGLKSTGKPTQAGENSIDNFTVYIYNGVSNLLEKTESYSAGNVTANFTKTISGLSTGAKKIVAVANVPAAYTVAAGSSYSDLATNMFGLDTQTDSVKLAMSGETTVTLAPAPTSNSVTILLYRVVAKVRLGTVTVTPDAGHNAALFTLDSAYIMKAKSTASIGIPPPPTTGPAFCGGIKANISTTAKPYLRDKRVLGATDNNNRYYYVFPNDNSANNGTLITLVGTYNGTRFYYPFRVNNGSLVRNTYYTVNVTIKRPGSGTGDPEAPVDPATLIVTVEPVDWTVVVGQDVEW